MRCFLQPSRHSQETDAVTLILQIRKLRPKVPKLESTTASSGNHVGNHVLMENIYRDPTVGQLLS